MKRIALQVALAIAVLAITACEHSHTSHSSGSNWIRCEALADCDDTESAAACDEDGYCADERGARIERKAAPPPADGGGSPSECAWDVDALLREVGVTADDRVNCGHFFVELDNGQTAFDLQCFDRERQSGRAVDVLIDPCFNCSVTTHFVATATNDLFAVTLEQDNSARPLARTKVEACQAVVLDRSQTVLECVGAVELQRCEEPLGPKHEQLAAPSGHVAPRKLAEAAAPASGPTVPLHVYVSNQSFDKPWVDIDVYLAGRPVIGGEYDVGSQHSWYLFDFQVPPGALTLSAASRTGNAMLEETIDVPAERWVVLNYWYYPGEDLGEHFTVNSHDQRPGFE